MPAAQNRRMVSMMVLPFPCNLLPERHPGYPTYKDMSFCSLGHALLLSYITSPHLKRAIRDFMGERDVQSITVMFLSKFLAVIIRSNKSAQRKATACLSGLHASVDIV